jgi:hypothetical protein
MSHGTGALDFPGLDLSVLAQQVGHRLIRVQAPLRVKRRAVERTIRRAVVIMT